ncbi:hypothetical protein EQ500_06095 [Lactobacillus sp. XV13L]|nr:hypothetical protein [Lactobacillus sp. XV13L]
MSQVLIESEDTLGMWADAQVSDWRQIKQEFPNIVLGQASNYVEAQQLVTGLNYNEWYQDYLLKSYLARTK